MLNIKQKNKQLLDFVAKESPFTPDITLILGSGFGEFAQNGNILHSISTASIPGYPKSTVEGHKGNIHFTVIGNRNVMVFDGRIHFYEGYSLSQCLIPVLIAKYLGSPNLLLTNAAGGVNENFTPGDLMLCTSFLSFNIKQELMAVMPIASPELRNRFLQFPSKKLGKLIEKAAIQSGVSLKTGVYWYNKGPAYETPAEIRMSKFLGSDAVGMSSAHEAIYAGYLGIETACISCITNIAAGLSVDKLSHEDVQNVAGITKSKIASLLIETIKSI